MERVKGIEPSAQSSQVVDTQCSATTANTGVSHIRSQIPGSLSPELAQLVEKWPQLPCSVQNAIIAIAEAVHQPNEGGES